MCVLILAKVIKCYSYNQNHVPLARHIRRSKYMTNYGQCFKNGGEIRQKSYDEFYGLRSINMHSPFRFNIVENLITKSFLIPAFDTFKNLLSISNKVFQKLSKPAR